MPLIKTLVRTVFSIAVLLPVALVVLQLVTGRIRLRGVLNVKRDADLDQLSPSRIQLLASTIIGSAIYVARVIANPVPGELPDIPHDLLPVLAASHATYIVGKALSTFRRTFPQP